METKQNNGEYEKKYIKQTEPPLWQTSPQKQSLSSLQARSFKGYKKDGRLEGDSYVESSPGAVRYQMSINIGN